MVQSKYQIKSPLSQPPISFPAIVRPCSPGLPATALGWCCKTKLIGAILSPEWRSDADTLVWSFPPGSGTQPHGSLLPHPTLHSFALTSHHSWKGMAISTSLCPLSTQLFSPEMLDLSLPLPGTSKPLLLFQCHEQILHSKQSQLFRAACAYFDHFSSVS